MFLVPESAQELLTSAQEEMEAVETGRQSPLFSGTGHPPFWGQLTARSLKTDCGSTVSRKGGYAVTGQAQARASPPH